jgi:hypothetical protein
MGIGLQRASLGRTEGQGSEEGGGAKRAHEKGVVGQLTTVRRVDVPKGQGGTGEGMGSGSGTLESGQSERTLGKFFHHVLFFFGGDKKTNLD